MPSIPAATSSSTRLLAEHVGGDPAAELVRPVDRRRGYLDRPQRGQVTDLPVDPVPHQLDPAVATGSLTLYLRDQRVRLDLGGVVAQIALWAGDVPAGSDDLGQVVPSSIHRVSAGLPASRSSRAPAARSAKACSWARSGGTAPWLSSPT